MKPLAIVLIAVISLVCLSSANVGASPGAQCFSDANCGYGEVCIKTNSWDPYGRCVRGSR